MWWQEYRDYPVDAQLKKKKVEPGSGIVGCEMHEGNGWGLSYHRERRRPPGLFVTLISYILRIKV